MNALLFDERLAETLDCAHGNRGQWLDYQRTHSGHPKFEADALHGLAKPLRQINDRIRADREEIETGVAA